MGDRPHAGDAAVEPPRAAAVIEAEAVAATLAAPLDEESGIALSAPMDDDGPPPIDEAAESAFRAEARSRGEPIAASRAIAEPEDNDPKSLPPLDVLVQRIPAEVRDVLEELFRARFVRVQRVPKRALHDTHA